VVRPERSEHAASVTCSVELPFSSNVPATSFSQKRVRNDHKKQETSAAHERNVIFVGPHGTLHHACITPSGILRFAFCLLHYAFDLSCSAHRVKIALRAAMDGVERLLEV
jgi:hypothetical protein